MGRSSGSIGGFTMASKAKSKARPTATRKALKGGSRSQARRPAKAKARKAPARVKPAAKVARVKKVLAARAKPLDKAVKKPAAVAPKKAPVAVLKTAKGRPAKGKNAPPAPVRPLGVLPPESRAKARRTGIDGPRIAYPRQGTTSTAATTVAQGAERLTNDDLKDFEQRLLAERQKIAKEMGHLESNVLNVNPRDSSGDLSGYSFHMADAGTDSMEREKAFLFASTEGRLLYEINDALRRLYNGDYGNCETCGEPIARARLQAMPHARQCVPCKSKEEQAGRGVQ
jgi:RNA polymerase-binding transcription factor DksA